MKFNAAAAATAAAVFAGVAHADEAEPSSVVVELPTFTVSPSPKMRCANGVRASRCSCAINSLTHRLSPAHLH